MSEKKDVCALAGETWAELKSKSMPKALAARAIVFLAKNHPCNS
jgi:hypothetical protein